MNSFSAIILGYDVKVKRVLTSFKSIWQKSLLHNNYSLYPHLGGVTSLTLCHFLHDEQIAEGLVKLN